MARAQECIAVAAWMGLSSGRFQPLMTSIPRSCNPAGRIHEADTTYCASAAAKPDYEKHRNAGAQRGTEQCRCRQQTPHASLGLGLSLPIRVQSHEFGARNLQHGTQRRDRLVGGDRLALDPLHGAQTQVRNFSKLLLGPAACYACLAYLLARDLHQARPAGDSSWTVI